MESDFKEWLNNTIGWLQWDGTRVAGEKQYNASSNFSCYVQGGSMMIRDAHGREITSAERVFINGSDTGVSDMSTEDRFILNSRIRVPLMVDPVYDEKGNLDHVVVYL